MESFMSLTVPSKTISLSFLALIVFKFGLSIIVQ